MNPGLTAQGSAWEKVKPKGEFFSVEMPYQPDVTRLESSADRGFNGLIFSSRSANGVQFQVKVIKGNERRLSEFRTNLSLLRDMVNGGKATLNLSSERSLDGSYAREYQFTTTDGAIGLVRFYITPQRVYVLETVGGLRDSSVMERFLDSFQFEVPTVEAEQPSRGTFRQSPPEATYRNPSGVPGCNCRYDYDRDPTICNRPEVTASQEELKLRPNGEVELLLTLTTEGRAIVDMSSVRVRGNVPQSLVQKAIDAASRISFCPAVQGGRTVVQQMASTYKFSTSQTVR